MCWRGRWLLTRSKVRKYMSAACSVGDVLVIPSESSMQDIAKFLDKLQDTVNKNNWDVAWPAIQFPNSLSRSSLAQR